MGPRGLSRQYRVVVVG